MSETYKPEIPQDAFWELVNTMSLSSIADLLRKYMLDSGHYSIVYRCPWDSTAVIKLHQPGDYEDIWKDGWLEFASIALEYKMAGIMNPLVPNIHRLWIHPEFKGYIAVMDRYTSFPDSPYGVVRKRYNSIRLVFGDRNSHPVTPSKFSNFDSDYLVYAMQLKCIPGFKVNDLHNGNIMLNGDHIVIIDPVHDQRYNPKVLHRLQRIGVISARAVLPPLHLKQPLLYEFETVTGLVPERGNKEISAVMKKVRIANGG